MEEEIIIAKRKKRESSEKKLFIFFFSLLLFVILIITYKIIPKDNKLLDRSQSIIIRLKLQILLIGISAAIFYHLIFYFYIGINYHSNQNIKCKSVNEEIYCNPVFYLFILYFFKEELFAETLDIFLWSFISIQFTFIYYYTLKLLQSFEEKLNKNLNLSKDNFIKLMHKTKVGITFLIIANSLVIITVFFLLIGELSIPSIFFIINNGLFNYCKIYEVYSNSQFDLFLRRDCLNQAETTFLNKLKHRFIIKFSSNILLALIFLILLPCIYKGSIYSKLFLLGMLLYQILFLCSLFIKYAITMQYFCSIGAFFPIVVRKDEECIICTEKLLYAKKLVCGHCFHFICLSQWIENGTKYCPLCRRNIEINRETWSLHNFEQYKLVRLLIQYIPTEL